jgi:hypothetical protein
MIWGSDETNKPSLAHFLPHVSVRGDQLQIIGSDPPYTGQQRFLVIAATQSTQSEEPLVRWPLQLSDSSPLRGCLVFPSGAIDKKGLCGASPSG